MPAVTSKYLRAIGCAANTTHITAVHKDTPQDVYKRQVVEEGATVEDAVLMDGVVVKAGAVVKRCILAEDLSLIHI